MKKLITFITIIFCLSQPLQANPIVDEIASQYVQLALALGQHDAGYIDAYYGPEAWQVQAKNKPMTLQKIIIAAKTVQDVVALQKSDDPMEQLRLAYLDRQLNALSAKAVLLIGHVKMDFDQQSLALYDTEAPHNALESFQPTLDELAKVLPGEGKLASRVDAFFDQLVIPADKLKVVMDTAIKACRERTKAHINLLPQENFTLEFVSDKPWSGYNWYKGDAFSLIQVNTELPIVISRAVDLGCHEGYPGHHTYNGLLEAELVKKRGWVEFSVYPLNSPQSLIAEGSANYGIEMAFPGNEKFEFERNVLFPLAGLNPDLAEPYAKVMMLMQRLNYAGNEIARLYMNSKIDADTAAEMLQDYAMMSPAKARQRVKFIETYGAYVINYNWGKDLVKKWVEAGSDQSENGRWQRFAQLLASPRLPSTLN